MPWTNYSRALLCQWNRHCRKGISAAPKSFHENAGVPWFAVILADTRRCS